MRTMSLKEGSAEDRGMKIQTKFLDLWSSAEALGEYGAEFLVEFVPAVAVDTEIEVAHRRRDEREGSWIESVWDKVAESDRQQSWQDWSTACHSEQFLPDGVPCWPIKHE